jgi:hypothetical protein
MIENPAIVTALFDIGRDKWSNYGLSYHTYMMWMRNLLLFDSKMVIYTEEKFEGFIKEQRSIVDPNLEKTIIVIDVIENLDSYKLFYDKVSTLMNQDNFKNKIHFNVPEMTQALYNIVIFNKPYFIKNSIENKHFDSDMFIWCDAGVLRNDNPEIKRGFPNVEKINQKYNDKITFFSHHEEFSVPDRPFHLLSQFRYIHGGCFFVPNNGVIYSFIKHFITLIQNHLDLEFVGSEEKYLDFCYLDNKENYNIIKSDWRQYFDIFK